MRARISGVLLLYRFMNVHQVLHILVAIEEVDPKVVNTVARHSLHAVIASERDVHETIRAERYKLSVNDQGTAVFCKAEEKLIEHRMRMWLYPVRACCLNGTH